MSGRNGFGLADRFGRDLSRFRELSWPERWLLFETQPVVLAMAIALRLKGYRRLRALLERSAPLSDSSGRREVDETTLRQRALRVAEVVDISLRRGVARGTCLEKSLALWWLLRRRGVRSDLLFGVRRREEFEAHAWVELDGHVLNDRGAPRELYAPIESKE